MEAQFLNLGGSAWDTLLDHTKDAIVFVDSKAGESLHWSLGVDSLLTKGSLGVKELNAFKYALEPKDDTRKAVFITASAYSTIQADISDIVCQSLFEVVILVLIPLPDSSTNIPRIRSDLLQWMAMKTEITKNLSAEVICFPYFIAPFTDTVLLLPPFRDLFPPLNLDKVMSFGGRTDTLSLKDQASAESLAVFLDSILGQIDASDVVFSIGNYSGSVAASLEGLPSANHRRKVGQHRFSVVIVDRTLDLCTPASVDSKCFLDKLLCTLPHLHDHTNDVAVNMSQLAQVTVDSVHDESLFPGCIAHHDSVCQNIREWLIHKKDRDILLNLHQVLKSKLSPDKTLSTRVKPEALEKDVRQFRGNLDKIQQNCGILQISLAVVQALTGEHAEELELVLSTERVLRQNVSTSVESCELTGLLPQMTKLLVERHIRGLSLDALLRLVILLYSLIGTDLTFPLKDEVQLQAAMSTALFEDQEYPGLVHEILLPLEATKERVDLVASHIFAIFKAVSHMRRDLSKYRSVLKGQGSSMPAEFTPFLQRLMRDILDGSKPPIPDLSCKSSGIRDILKSGFSMLLNKQAAPVTQHPSDQPNLLFVVLGGITGGEIRSLQEAWASSAQFKAGGTLLIASTRLLSPNDTLQALLRSTPPPL